LQIISYGTTQITERLDNGRSIAEKFATIGIVLAGLSALISPVALLTSYYGMNVQEYVPGTSGSLFEFWQVALPTLLVCLVALGFVILRLWSTPMATGAT
jgi:Mg2+ and Co2+ transporter CorA